MLLKYYHVLHLLAKFKFLAIQLIDEDFSLNIYQMTINTSEPTK
jgi:hypothetical protein